MTKKEFKNLLEIHSKPELAEQDGMVYQVWEDGEITLQKSGKLLWKRTIHIIVDGIPSKKLDPNLFLNYSNDHGYIFTDKNGADTIRNVILLEVIE